MSVTKAEIRDKALKKLGVFGTGTTASSGKAADLDQAYLEVYEQLLRRRLVTWDTDEEIPNEYVHSVVALVADARKDEYRIPNDLFQRITLDARGDNTVINPGALANIRTVQASNVYKTPTADYF